MTVFTRQFTSPGRVGASPGSSSYAVIRRPGDTSLLPPDPHHWADNHKIYVLAENGDRALIGPRPETSPRIKSLTAIDLGQVVAAERTRPESGEIRAQSIRDRTTGAYEAYLRSPVRLGAGGFQTIGRPRHRITVKEDHARPTQPQERLQR